MYSIQKEEKDMKMLSLGEQVSTLQYDDELDDELKIIFKLRHLFTRREYRDILVILAQEMTLEEAKAFLGVS